MRPHSLSLAVGSFVPLVVVSTLCGAQTTGSVFGRVVDANGQPVVQAKVRVARDSVDLSRAEWTFCDRTGSFRIARLAAGAYKLYWAAPGHYEEIEVIGAFPGGMPQRPTATVESGRESGPVSLPMRRTSVQYGRVLAADGRPVRSATIRFQVPGPALTRTVCEVRTDALGMYEREASYEGDDSVQIMEPGYGYAPGIYFTLKEGSRTRVDVRLRRPASVAGQVIAPDGRPAVGALVLWGLDDPGTEWRYHQKYATLHLIGNGSTLTDGRGNFSVPCMPSGTCHLGAYSDPKASKPDAKEAVQLADGERRYGVVLRLPMKP